jgi:DNA-binding MarR family transcriptional regulator
MTSNSPSLRACAAALLDAVLPVIWFIRPEMRRHRGGLSVPQFRALVMVEQWPSTNLSAVAENLAASLPTASRIVSGLVSKGLIRRCACPQDRRRISLCVTARGQTVIRGARGATESRIARELQLCSPRQRDTVTEAMQILKDRFGATEPCDESGKTAEVARRPANGRSKEKNSGFRSRLTAAASRNGNGRH